MTFKDTFEGSTHSEKDCSLDCGVSFPHTHPTGERRKPTVEGTETEEAWEKGWDTVSHDLLLNAQKYPSRILDAVLPLLLKQRDADKAFIREILQSIRADERAKLVEVVKGLRLKPRHIECWNGQSEPCESCIAFQMRDNVLEDVLAKISQV
jgi:hypothetical protein